METPAHKALKAAGLTFLLAQGCAAAAREVQCPISRYRVDIAGYFDKLPARSASNHVTPNHGLASAPQSQTVLIECKASRADLFRDGRTLPRMLERRDRLRRLCHRFEHEHIRVLEPHLRRAGQFLFPEMEEWDYTSSRLSTYRALLRHLRRAEHQVYDQTKFFMISRYALAARLYLLTPTGMVAPAELPAGWGLLELSATEITIRVPATAHNPRPDRVTRLLRNIAATASRAALHAPPVPVLA